MFHVKIVLHIKLDFSHFLLTFYFYFPCSIGVLATMHNHMKMAVA